MIFHSIRWRLQIWYGLILLVLLAGFALTAYQLARAGQFRQLDDELRRRAGQLVNVLRPGPPGRGRPEEFGGEGPPPGQPRRPPRPPREQQPPPDRPPEGAEPEPFPRLPEGFRLPPFIANSFDETDTNGFYYVIIALSPERRELTRSSNAPPEAGSALSSATLAALRRDPGKPPRQEASELPLAQNHGSFRELFLSPPHGPAMPPEVRGTIIVVGHSITKELSELRLFAWMLTGVGGIILLLGLAGGWWLASRAIRPIEDISAAAVKISAGDLAQRINVGDTESELGRLAQVLNSAFARLESAFAQQQQFTSDAAHELRTPVSVMLTQVQTALNRERGAAEYRETVEACQRAAQRMRQLIESLLELARLDAGQETMKRAPFDLARVAADCLELIRPLAVARGLALHSDLSAAESNGDADRLAQVITNLLSNAIHYNKDGGEVRIATARENDFVVLTVSDTGAGIAAEHLPHVFERFYRADAARTASQGRAGLGLSISKAIVEAHGGSIEVSSEPGLGTKFTVRLPIG